MDAMIQTDTKIAASAREELAYAEERLADYESQHDGEWSPETRSGLREPVVVLRRVVHGPPEEQTAIPPLPSPPRRKTARLEWRRGYYSESDDRFVWRAWEISLEQAAGVPEPNSTRWHYQARIIDTGAGVVWETQDSRGGVCCYPEDDLEAVAASLGKKVADLGYDLEAES